MKFLITLLFVTFLTGVQARDINSIKNDIIKLAESYTGQTDPDGRLQKSLEVLIEELKEEIPVLTMQERAVRALGVWNQIWGPYAFDDSNRKPPGIDVKNIYQFISPEGFYYNFGEYNFLGINTKFFVKGKYEILEDRIGVEFTGQGLVREREVDYATLGDDIEAGAVRVTNFPSRFPPTGVTGGLVEIYADDDLRINYGTVGDDITNPSLFIMRRVK